MSVPVSFEGQRRSHGDHGVGKGKKKKPHTTDATGDIGTNFKRRSNQHSHGSDYRLFKTGVGLIKSIEHLTIVAPSGVVRLFFNAVPSVRISVLSPLCMAPGSGVQIKPCHDACFGPSHKQSHCVEVAIVGYLP